MKGAEAVVALVLVEWTTGWLGVAAWTQSWGVVKRGHFRILAWVGVALALLGFLAVRSAAGPDGETATALTLALLIAALGYLVVQRMASDVLGVAVGAVGAFIGALALVAAGDLLEGWSLPVAAGQLVVGAVLLGAVANGMMLGHWYLNQPGLKPWALARLTQLALAAAALSALAGVAANGILRSATTPGAVLGLPGFGESFGNIFWLVWLAFVGFTAAVVWGARRCVKIRSIQSATGLYYVALLTAGVAEFLVRYLMANVS